MLSPSRLRLSTSERRQPDPRTTWTHPKDTKHDGYIDRECGKDHALWRLHNHPPPCSITLLFRSEGASSVY